MTRCAKYLKALGITGEVEKTLLHLRTLFSKWNTTINLSGAKTLDEIDEQIFDCLHVVPYLRSQSRVLDVGSGGGFPLVIAAICLPDVEFVGLEPVHKKHAFLRTAARTLGLANVECLAIRLEDYETAGYDTAMSRATFELDRWLALGATLIAPGGIVIGFEGSELSEHPQVERFSYELLGKRRAIIILRS